jgi:hypothetical protein
MTDYFKWRLHGVELALADVLQSCWYWSRPKQHRQSNVSNATKTCVQPRQQPIKLGLVASANSTGPRDRILQSLIGLLSSYVLAMHLWDLKHGKFCWSRIHEMQPGAPAIAVISNTMELSCGMMRRCTMYEAVARSRTGKMCICSVHSTYNLRIGFDSTPTMAGVPRMRTRLRHR